ncbi:AP2/ERF domain-containing protein [Artemisia annua]|uniref:AP2/ERF domain-containing protein n=1 Tax=Artemisia annua TaxID=35608 RepID=A0A2U1LXE8_ARTAN|nr:AP2/ERF domain-containing protein [Artemisia annua]
MSQSSSSKLLSATLTAKLHRCYMASLQMSKPSIQQQQQLMSQKRMCSTHSGSDSSPESEPECKPRVVMQQQQPSAANSNELLHYGSIELCSIGQSQN